MRANHEVARVHFIEGAYCEIAEGDPDKIYVVDFVDNASREVLHSQELRAGQWVQLNRKYFFDCVIRVRRDGGIIFEHEYNAKNKRVYVPFTSAAIGDTLAWIPYVEEFKNTHECDLVCSTHQNDLIKAEYPGIEFIRPGEVVENLYAAYKIGWYYDFDYNPNDVRTIPLQQTASDILGLDFREIPPRVTVRKEISDYRPGKKYVCIATQSTAQCKYWNEKGGWGRVVEFLKRHDYEVLCIDEHERFGISGFRNSIPGNAVDRTGGTLDEAISLIKNAEFFVGLSSGLSWLSWAVGTPVVLVSSFTKPFFEFQSNCVRVYSEGDRSGYHNSTKYRLDPGDWNWNPYRKIVSMSDWHDLETISSQQVIESIKKLL